MFTWKRSLIVTSWRADAREEIPDVQVEAIKERIVRFFEGLAKGTLAVVLYGSGTLPGNWGLRLFLCSVDSCPWRPAPIYSCA